MSAERERAVDRFIEDFPAWSPRHAAAYRAALASLILDARADGLEEAAREVDAYAVALEQSCQYNARNAAATAAGHVWRLSLAARATKEQP